MSKTDNAHLQDKLKLRRLYLDNMKSGFSVIDCCAGGGHIWDTLRAEYSCRYWGIDIKPKNGRLKAKSERILSAGAIADVIDIDTYGSPWKHWFALLPHINRKTTAFLTIGSTHTGNQQKEAIRASGLQFVDIACPPTLSAKFRDVITACCLNKCREYGLQIGECRRIVFQRVSYWALILKPKKAQKK